MASIFTYDPDPPRVSSPWEANQHALTPGPSEVAITTPPFRAGKPLEIGYASPQPSSLADCGVVKLDAEPQEGGTEYKLHLLLRPRRSFTASSTGIHVVGSQHSKHNNANPSAEGFLVGSSSENNPASVAASNHSRQHRLQQLTTQLLWRLQQSSPYHSSSTSNVVLPNLTGPRSAADTAPQSGRLLPGIEESRGAYYEIGVSDDGTLVGLTQDEMDESLGTLKIMATSLGCCVEVLRMVVVGECEWIEEVLQPGSGSEGFANLISKNDPKREACIERPSVFPSPPRLEQNPTSTFIKHVEKLWVAEAIVKPNLESSTQEAPKLATTSTTAKSLHELPTQVTDRPERVHEATWCPTDQLRVSLTGATTSGKSSLLGTLTTATKDNGRGKSRLSLLRHRHELVSGITSSVAQELIGYKTTPLESGNEDFGVARTEIINYASGNVSSWTDIHASSETGRLVLLSDCAGHPRYRRTTVRGLVGWAPHWVALCVSADDKIDGSWKDNNSSSPRDTPTFTGAGLDISAAHLELCLRLCLPVVVIVTKLDLASKSGLRNTLAKVLSTLKAAGRKPVILPAGGSPSEGGLDLNTISAEDETIVERTISTMRCENPGIVVPIVLTSAVNGTGIGKVHSLLHRLPLPEDNARTCQHEEATQCLHTQVQPSKLFHIEEIFALPKRQVFAPEDIPGIPAVGSVLSGHLRYGQLSLGDHLILGPFDSKSDLEGLDSTSFELEWLSVRVVSIRNLRLPVRHLYAGQTGTVGVVYCGPVSQKPLGPRGILHDDGREMPAAKEGDHDKSDWSSSPLLMSSIISSLKVRKGMLLINYGQGHEKSKELPVSYVGFTARFSQLEVSSVTVGALVVVYIGSVRTTAKVVQLYASLVQASSPSESDSEPDNMFCFDDRPIHEPQAPECASTEVVFQFVLSREWIEVGREVLLMPGGGPGLYGGTERGEKGVGGLEGFVGRIVEVIQ